jgi:hypothetical protein
LIQINNPEVGEIVKCIGRTGDFLTVERGQENTQPQIFNISDNVQLRITAQSLNLFAQGGGGGGGGSAATQVAEFTATQGQTVFTLPFTYIPDEFNLAVFVNGSKQIVDVNYSESSSTTITFFTGLNVGDAVEVVYNLPIAAGQLDASNILYDEGGVGAVQRTVQVKLQESVSVKDFGAVGNGTTDDTAAIQAALTSGSTNVYFPNGKYLITSTITINNDAVRLYGDSKGDANYCIIANSDIEMFKVVGNYVTFDSLRLSCTSATHSKRHIQTYSASGLTVVNCYIVGVDGLTATGSGVGFGDGFGGIAGNIGNIDRTIIDNGSVDVATWDVHITNSWVWGNTRAYAIRAVGSVGNLTIVATDIVPPRLSRTDRKAGIYFSGPVLQPIVSSCYIDGNPSLALGYGLLAENGVLNMTVDSLRANLNTDSVIVLDSVIGPVIKGCTFYNNNKSGIGANDILMRQNFTQPLERPVIIANTFIQTTTVSGTLGYAIQLVEPGTQKNGVRIEQNSIQQPSGGGGYQDQEIEIGGAFTSPGQGTLRQNRCTRKQTMALAQVAFGIGSTSTTLTFSETLMYAPRVDQIRINFVGEALPYNIGTITTTSVVVNYPSSSVGGFIYCHVDLD